MFAVVEDGIHLLPVVHDRLEAADAVRAAFEALDPEAVAVEIPSSLGKAWLRAVERLPAISVLLYETSAGETIYLPIHPADAMVEAARGALERGLPLACADLDVDGYADWRDPVPDAYALFRLGPLTVWDVFRRHPRAADPHDAPREASMAFHARRLREAGASRVLVVCGMHHVEGIGRALGSELAEPLTPPERKNVRLVNLHPESVGEVLGEVPFYAAAFEAIRSGLEVPGEEPPAAPGRIHGPFRILSGGRGDDPVRVEHAVRRAAAGRSPCDRLRLQWGLVRETERALAASAPDERVEPWQRRNLARFARNLAAGGGGLVCDLYDLLAAARGCVTENFAWELHRLATSWPWQQETAADLPTARIRAEEMFDGVRRIRLTRRRRQARSRRPESLLRRRRRDERYPGEWLRDFDGESVCSYPPEDVIVEAFGEYLRRRGKSVLREEASRVVPFTTSVLDGIDVRETIRHWSEHRIWVRESGRAPGEVGAVVVIFDDERDGEERYPFAMTWLGEHAQESDMAFYATAPEQAVVGPGICRVTYGGFLLSYPPGRLREVWTDADYAFAQTRPERLLLAALDYSLERVVVHVAPRPPRPVFHQIAARLDRKILHLPIGTISPGTVRRIRVLHVLSGRERRDVAREYIW
jgi:hypothetical protein